MLERAGSLGLVVVLGPYHQMHGDLFDPPNTRAYARWLAQRYADVLHLVWTMYPRAEPASVPIVEELAAGLQEGDGRTHLITVHPDPST